MRTVEKWGKDSVFILIEGKELVNRDGAWKLLPATILYTEPSDESKMVVASINAVGAKIVKH